MGTLVGDAIAGGTSVMSFEHPSYIKMTQRALANLQSRMVTESERRSRTDPVLLPHHVTPAVGAQLAEHFPEFTVESLAMCVPPHQVLVVYRHMSQHLLLRMARRFGDSVVLCGGFSTVSMMHKQDLQVHVELNGASSVVAQDAIQDANLSSRMAYEFQAMGAAIGPNDYYANYLSRSRGDNHVVCTSGASCKHQAEVLAFDMMSTFVSPVQVAGAMLQSGSDVACGFFPYTTDMLVNDEGEFADTGVRFKKTSEYVELIYPDGQVGVARVPLSVWSSWLCEHEVTVGFGANRKVFHLQLNKSRGPFMFFEMVRVEQSVAGTVFRHALQLRADDGARLITSWKLKSLAAPVNDKRSYEPCRVVVPGSLYVKMTEFAMRLPAADFSRANLRKHVRTLDRVTIEGVRVVSMGSIAQLDVEAIVTAVYAYCFVERYESGRLSADMLDVMKSVSWFGTAPVVARLSAVASWCWRATYMKTLGIAANAVRQFCDWLNSWYHGRMDMTVGVSMAPTVVVMSDVVAGYVASDKCRAAMDIVAKSVKSASSGAVATTVRGALLASAVASRGKTVLQAEYARVSSLFGAAVGPVEVELADLSSVETVLDAYGMDNLREALASDMSVSMDFREPGVDQFVNPTWRVRRGQMTSARDAPPDYERDDSYIDTMSEVYASVFPVLARTNLEADQGSLAFDPQDRSVVADRLQVPRIMDDVPKDRQYYYSKIAGYGAPKRQETAQELLSSMNARNMAAPNVSLPQNSAARIPEIWDKFLDNMCVPGAREVLQTYRSDSLALEEDAYLEWQKKANPDALARVRKVLDELDPNWEDMDVHRYEAMIKSDVKPALSTKPERERTEPQVIVYHEKLLSSLYSSMYRVVTRRFLSLLKPNFHVNLLKDTVDMEDLARLMHDYDADVKYWECDFSKYDKSQDKFVFDLEAYVFHQLGVDEKLLQKWVQGHVTCTIRSMVTGIRLQVQYQRKSGDATTALGNVILNVLSVNYAVDLADAVWGFFMGDDSLVCVKNRAMDSRAVQVLAEIFNLTAKMYVSDYPYFASNFVMVDVENRSLVMVPDPVKRIERWLRPVSADDPKWREMWVSARDACTPYRHSMNVVNLGRSVAERYMVSVEQADRLACAIATATDTYDAFRALYEEKSQLLAY